VRHHLVQRIIQAYDSFGRVQPELPLGMDGEPASETKRPVS